MIPLHIEQDKLTSLNVKLLNNKISKCVIKLTYFDMKKKNICPGKVIPVYMLATVS